jgi:uncharacterized metal-binding protein
MNCALCEDKVCRDGQDCTGEAERFDELYRYPGYRQIAAAAGRIEAERYGEACRLEELIAFAQRLGCRHLGIAFCFGLSEEARRLEEILSRDFKVSSVCCKVGGRPSAGDLQELKRERGMSAAACNPLGQAEVLNQCGTDLNILVGLCIGHDVLFNKHSQAPATTFIVKDRVLAHNPAGALYCRYIRRRFNGKSDGTPKPEEVSKTR